MPSIRLPPCLAFLIALALAGCGMTQINLDPTRATAIKTVGVLTPASPRQADVLILNNGIRGGLIDLVLQNRREETLRRVIADQRFSIQDEFLSRLQASLRAKGLAVALIPVERDGRSLLSRYPAGAPGVDALLDSAIAIYGYIAPNLDTEEADAFVPLLEVNARLVDARTSAVLMQRTIEQNPFLHDDKIVQLEPASTPHFKAVSDIRKNPVEVVAGLRQAADEAAETAAKLVR